MKEPFLEARPVIEKLAKNGFEAYFVGGSVRDVWLGREISDIDIATSATPDEVMALFPNHLKIGLQHGTIMVKEGIFYYEVTTFRTESGYDDFRHPNEVQFVTSIEADLSRRDFTMNAMAMDQSWQIIDPFLGKQDLKGKMIRTVGIAQERFSEDPLRMMRAVRFMSELDFTLDDDTKEAIHTCSKLLKKVAVERIRIEFEKLFMGIAPCPALEMICSTDVYQYLPGLARKRDELLTIAGFNLTALEQINEHWALLIFLLDIKDIDPFLRAWKLQTALIKEIKQIVSTLAGLNKQEDWCAQIVYELGAELASSTARVYALVHDENQEQMTKMVQDLWHNLPIHSRQELQITGTNLIEWYGKAPGPWVASLIKQIEEAVVSGRVNNKNGQIKRWLESWDLK